MKHTFRYIVADAAPGACVRLSETDAHHLVRVVRRGVGDQIEVIDEAGMLWPATIVALTPSVELRLADVPSSTRMPLPVRMAVGLAEFGRLDTLVEKLTELGVDSVRFFTSERARRVPDPAAFQSRRARLIRVAEAAARQSGSGRAVKIDADLAPLGHLIKLNGGPGSRLIVDPRGDVGLGESLRRSGATSAELLIGPDAGFSATELGLARDAGIEVARLGEAILRTETAGIVAATICAEVFGFLGSA